MKARLGLLAIGVGMGLAGCQLQPAPNFVERDRPSEANTRPEQGPINLTAQQDTKAFKEISFGAQNTRTLVIMYHDVIPNREPDSLFYDVAADEFRREMEFLQANGATVISLDQMYEALTEGKELPPRSVVLTFDDNYQGVYDYAWPVMREYGYPFTVFVHTDYVGVTNVGRPKMTWETLRELRDSGLATIASHTASHPQDISKVSVDQIYRELRTSRQEIKDNLGIDTPYLSWPGGNYDAFAVDVAETVGYKMAFAMRSGLAQQSPGIMEILRYPFNKLDDGWKALLKEEEGKWGFAQTKMDPDAMVRLEEVEVGSNKRKVAAIVGGQPTTSLISGRKQVQEFVTAGQGVAGVNGGFFVDANIQSNDFRMMGPCVPGNTGIFSASADLPNLEKLTNRPLVMWDGESIAFVPYVHAQMNQEFRLRQFMPNMTDAFLAGAWLVKDGVVFSKEQIQSHGASDSMEIRPRSFIGVRPDGTMVLGSSKNALDSVTLAEAAFKLGCWNAALLDSGYSTSLVFGDKVVATGLRREGLASRPIPHAIVVQGKLEPNVTQAPDSITAR